ncbi:hypothetical protein BKP37_13875 [Anaerobacillus alkalilacustris]|uniref:DUF1538 domain-containing protein n=1 Tax=Anaerobacillus alkalilacustris TaxID=393763 RepID=A0A1S2LJC7_9BACI|nr:DUF1538 domain-containing protein [Anaerobacillus alkalilacustris]OIJ12511.1 hypothetical protein BKP37_13875 [Anaerobacillus alkalilacustris]
MNIQIFKGFSHVLLEVTYALLPLVILFLLFQLFFLKLNRRKLINIGKGILLSFLGLAFFLQGVHVGFFPVGEMIGEKLGSLSFNWILVPIGFIFGFVATFAEPAVKILNHEVEKVSGGSISQKVMLYTLSIGVAFSIALSMLRILLGIPLWYFIIPGYLIALILMYFSSKRFTAIAFDSGGVATGPMTVTFILAIGVGVASEIDGRNPLLDGFGMIALVALSPIISVLTLGLLYEGKGRQHTNDHHKQGA